MSFENSVSRGMGQLATASAPPQNEIPAKLADIANILTDIENLQTAIANRLEPVLISPDAAKSAAIPSPDSATPLGVSLASIYNRLRVVLIRQEDIIDRCQL